VLAQQEAKDLVDNPMQGLFNLIVFIFPKVKAQLRGNHEYNLWQDTIAATQSTAIVRRRNIRVPLQQASPPAATATQEKEGVRKNNSSDGGKNAENKIVTTGVDKNLTSEGGMNTGAGSGEEDAVTMCFQISVISEVAATVVPPPSAAEDET
jgi:hypothetical protein